jgi:hypothetical protein
MAWAAAEADGRVQTKGGDRKSNGQNTHLIADPRVYFAKQFGSNVTAPCGRITHGVISGATPHPEPPMPLSFSAEEMDLLLELSRPIEPAQRSAFLDAVAAAIGEQASGPGLVHQTARRIQREFWTPPQISPNATAPVHRGHAA